MITWSEILSAWEYRDTIVFIFMFILCFCEFSKIKIKPISWVVGKLGINDIKETLNDLDKKYALREYKRLRKDILDYAKEVKYNIEHTKGDRETVEDTIADYNIIVDKYGIDNGYCDEAIKYIREKEEIIL